MINLGTAWEQNRGVCGAEVWGSAPLSNIWYLRTGYDYSQSSVMSNKVLTYMIWNLSNLKKNKIFCHLLYKTLEECVTARRKEVNLVIISRFSNSNFLFFFIKLNNKKNHFYDRKHSSLITSHSNIDHFCFSLKVILN